MKMSIITLLIVLFGAAAAATGGLIGSLYEDGLKLVSKRRRDARNAS
jgi:hypothetical protein